MIHKQLRNLIHFYDIVVLSIVKMGVNVLALKRVIERFGCALREN